MTYYPPAEQSLEQTAKDHPLDKVIKGGYCIGCGACALLSSDIQIKETPYGLYQADLVAHTENSTLIATDRQEQLEKIAAVCPFTSTTNETDLGEKRHSSGASFDPRIGYYQGLLAGHVDTDSYRALGSSGGVMSWVLAQLLEQGKVDGVIHVSATDQSGNLFEYSLSHSVEEVIKGAKSRYYPVQMSEILRQIKQSGKRYALVGVPCFIKAARLLAEQDQQIANALSYYLAIFCGHFKSKAFAEMVAWQCQISPNQLSHIDFRVKDPSQPANRYKIQVQGWRGDKGLTVQARVRELFGMDWGLGYFKPKACDWCDDIAGEGADLACGDAWLPAFVDQSEGNNVVVVRHPELLNLLQVGIESNALKLTDLKAEDIVVSQAANYRHRHEGLALRIAAAAEQKEWHPQKRIVPLSSEELSAIPEYRQQIYRQREQLAEQSHQVFYQAKQRASLLYFYWRMLPLELRYHYTQGNLIKGGLKSLYTFAHYGFRRITSLCR